MSDTVTPAFKAGAEAYIHNLKLREPAHPDRRRNPHPNGSQESRDWTDGFFGVAERVIAAAVHRAAHRP